MDRTWHQVGSNISGTPWIMWYINQGNPEDLNSLLQNDLERHIAVLKSSTRTFLRKTTALTERLIWYALIDLHGIVRSECAHRRSRNAASAKCVLSRQKRFRFKNGIRLTFRSLQNLLIAFEWEKSSDTGTCASWSYCTAFKIYQRRWTALFIHTDLLRHLGRLCLFHRQIV